MLARSFRLVASLIPGADRPKRVALPMAAGAVLSVIVAGCGGSPAAKPQRVSATGYHFDAPASWRVVRTRIAVTADAGDDLVQVSAFPLAKPYRASLFDRVAPELQAQLGKAAASVGGKIEDAGDVTAGGVRSHVFRVRVGDHVDEYTFVLVGRREFQLLCRAKEVGSAACKQLQTSFELS
jgi:hypothetical protein